MALLCIFDSHAAVPPATGMGTAVDISAMSQLDEAIARYHKILESEPHRDLAWATQLQSEMEAERLSFGGRLICPFLRPHFITRRQYDSLVKSGETLISAVDRLQEMVLKNPAMLAQLQTIACREDAGGDRSRMQGIWKSPAGSKLPFDQRLAATGAVQCRLTDWCGVSR